jgi:hypothetical protein
MQLALNAYSLRPARCLFLIRYIGYPEDGGSVSLWKFVEILL